MKLLLENWREYITEDWRDTSWKNDEDEVTIGEVVGYLGDKTVDINVLKLSQQLPPLPTRGAERVAEDVVQAYRERVNRIQRDVNLIPPEARPRTALIEWIEPVMVAGNWMPELLRLAGGRGPDFQSAEKSHFTTWDSIGAFDPDVVIFCPCGFDLQRTKDEIQTMQNPGFLSLRAAHKGSVYAVDGNAYFNRSGPRLVDSLAILAHLLHPQQISPPALTSSANAAWSRLY